MLSRKFCIRFKVLPLYFLRETTLNLVDDDIFELRGEKRLNQTKRTDQTKH